jgi:hypothetical protein
MKACGEVGCSEEEITLLPAPGIETQLLGRPALRSEVDKPTTFNNNDNDNNNNKLGKHEVKELQKTAILGTAHILRKVLM